MGKCWQKLGQAKRTTQQFLCDYYVLLWSNCQMFSIFVQLVITQSLNVTCWACPTYMYISQNTHLLRQSFSHYKSCNLLHRSNIMSVRYTATEAVSQSLHVSLTWIVAFFTLTYLITTQFFKLPTWKWLLSHHAKRDLYVLLTQQLCQHSGLNWKVLTGLQSIPIIV